MKKNPEQKLDIIINTINQEQNPNIMIDEIEQGTAEMVATVRAVKFLAEPVDPSPDFSSRLYDSIGILPETLQTKSLRKNPRQNKLLLRLTAITAVVILFLSLTFWFNFFNNNVVYAMEKAVQKLSSYHGVIEVSNQNADGEKWLVREIEIWSEGEKYALRQNDGTLTVNNGARKWQIREDERVVSLLPIAPDYTKRGFDLQDEANRAKAYPYTIVGQENIAGRKSIHLKISPPGGEAYDLWIDTETNLPLQLQTAVQNALQTTYTFTSLEPNVKISPEIFSYQVAEGYTVVEENPGQLVNTIGEAVAISHFTPLLPQKYPARIIAYDKHIVLDFADTQITEVPATGLFEPAGYGVLGEVNGEPVEVIGHRIRFRQGGLEITIEGQERLQLARQIAPNLTLPDKNLDLTSQAEIKVPVDLTIVKAEQKQVDGGHGPWQLDPLSVALTFVNLKVTPEGIAGEPEIPYSALKIGNNTGVEVIVDVKIGPVRKVYLKRLVRQDESGIWTVVGYDSR